MAMNTLLFWLGLTPLSRGLHIGDEEALEQERSRSLHLLLIQLMYIVVGPMVFFWTYVRLHLDKDNSAEKGDPAKKVAATEVLEFAVFHAYFLVIVCVNMIPLVNHYRRTRRFTYRRMWAFYVAMFAVAVIFLLVDIFHPKIIRVHDLTGAPMPNSSPLMVNTAARKVFLQEQILFTAVELVITTILVDLWVRAIWKNSAWRKQCMSLAYAVAFAFFVVAIFSVITTAQNLPNKELTTEFFIFADVGLVLILVLSASTTLCLGHYICVGGDGNAATATARSAIGGPTDTTALLPMHRARTAASLEEAAEEDARVNALGVVAKPFFWVMAVNTAFLLVLVPVFVPWSAPCVKRTSACARFSNPRAAGTTTDVLMAVFGQLFYTATPLLCLYAMRLLLIHYAALLPASRTRRQISERFKRMPVVILQRTFLD